ncbi:MAG: FliG C-terminal domain-containing protein [Bacteroidota bacterium]|nr:FliG C-terminal domain-containing protein [Bacteroidota bacterium]
MRSICFYFQVHQPFRLRTYRFFDIGEKHDYFDEINNEFILKRVAEKCYLPANEIIYDLVRKYGGRFKASYSISGTAMDQFEQFAPEVLESFKKLADTGHVEFLAETYSHSLSSLKSKEEFFKQVDIQRELIKKHFGQEPRTFRNTELIYSDGIGEMVSEMGFDTMLTEGAKHVLGWKSPNFLYCNAINPRLKMLLKNFSLSDDIAFRFSQRSWQDWPLTAEKFAGWLQQIDSKEEIVNLFMDYETFGEHQWPETGIFEFLKALPEKVFEMTDFGFSTPAEASRELQVVSAINVPYPISWADEERDLTAWLGNDLQDEAFDKLYEIEQKVKYCDDPRILKDWYYLQTSDHFYYMCTKWFSDGDVHKYFNPYGTPYEAFINYMNILSDFILRVNVCYDPVRARVGEIREQGSQFASRVKSSARKQTEKSLEKVRSKIDEFKAKDLGFEEIAKLSNKRVKEVLKKVNTRDLAIALKNTSEEVREKVYKNMGKRAQANFDELEQKLKNVKSSDIKKQREKIMRQIRKYF